MSSTRFARAGRWRFFICLGVLILMCGMIALFHNQQELDEKREQRLRSLNEQLQSIIEKNYQLERNHESERMEQLEARHDLEQKIKSIEDLKNKEQLRYEKLQQANRLLQSQHKNLEDECNAAKKQHSENVNDLERKLQSVRVELQKEKNVQFNEMNIWKEKYNGALQEKERLELLLNAADAKGHLQERITDLEHKLSVCLSQYDGRSKEDAQAQQIRKPPQEDDKPQSILPKSIKKPSEETETQLRQQETQQSGAAEAAAVVAVGNKMVSPLSAPRKPTSTEATKSEKHILDPNVAPAPLKQATNASAAGGSSSSTTSSLAPLPLPPNNLRKLPENVAPIPANFEDLLKHEKAVQRAAAAKKQKKPSAADAADIDAAVEVDLQKNDNDIDDANNNRYANVVNDMEAQAHKEQRERAAAAAANEDSGAHEIKDHDFVNDQNFNLPPAGEEDGNFFDGAAGLGGAGGAIGAEGKNDVDIGEANETHNKKHEDNNDDDDMLGVGGADTGDIAVKNHDHLLNGGDLNNEVVGDQGKEFPGDGLRLEDGNEEDEDEDDYSNLAARQQGAQAIRN